MAREMKAGEPAFPDIDGYVAAFPAEVRERLEQLRRTIREAAPEATEAIKYQMPTFVLNGNLVHFGAFKNHIGFYPVPREHEMFRQELSAYEGRGATVRFPIDEPLPLDLIARIVRFRVSANSCPAPSAGGAV